jgi:transcriptional regulator with XRE-family HTH domain
MSDIYTFIGHRVREERQLRGLSIERLAELADLTPSFLGSIERGERKLSVLSLDKLSKALQTQSDVLMNAQNKRPAPAWERKILFLINSQPERAKELMFKTLNCLAKSIQLSK